MGVCSLCLRRESFGGSRRPFPHTGGLSAHSHGAVIGYLPNRFSIPLTLSLLNGRAPSFHGRYPASSLLCAPPTPVQAAFRLCLPLGVGFHPPDGSPRFLDQSFDARCPQPPRLSSTVAFARSSPWIPDFGTSGILGRLASSVSRPNRVHLRYGSRLRFERLRSTDYSILRSLSYMSYEQFTWRAPFFLLD